jgi:thioredoxin
MNLLPHHGAAAQEQALLKRSVVVGCHSRRRRVVENRIQIATPSSFVGVQITPLRLTRAESKRATAGYSPRVSAALVQKVSARELDDILANERTSPMVVDFYATWCGPCILLAQELEQLAVEYGDRVRFLKIDTDEEHELANQMEIRGLPTMVFVSPDTEKLAIRTEGLLATNVIRDIIEKEL